MNWAQLVSHTCLLVLWEHLTLLHNRWQVRVLLKTNIFVTIFTEFSETLRKNSNDVKTINFDVIQYFAYHYFLMTTEINSITHLVHVTNLTTSIPISTSENVQILSGVHILQLTNY